MYLPFWSFSMLAESRWSADVGEHWYRTETYTTTRKRQDGDQDPRGCRRPNGGTSPAGTTATTAATWSPAAAGCPSNDAERIKPFHLAALKRYEPVLPGRLARAKNTRSTATTALRVCQAGVLPPRAAERGRPSARRHPPQPRSRTPTFSDVNSDLILLPIYLLSYRYRDKLYRFLLNGQTGKAAGEKPLSWRRILAAVGITLATVAAVAGLMALLGSILH